MISQNNTPILIYDGVCNLCNGVVGWALNAAPENSFDFVPFQSLRGQKLLKKHDFPLERLDTLIFINEHRVITHSDAFLKMMQRAPRYRWLAYILKLVPIFFRDQVYKTASKYRIKWFGNRTQSCTVAF
ncbi:thiol-disulfide oxidoreductase DCC family protein [Flavobacteriaceae bacterium M23B6Z8]